MCEKSTKIKFYNIVKAMSNAMDLISETLVGHHRKVAYISLQLGQQLGLSFEEKQKLVIAGLIHDLGVFYLNEKFSDLSFDNKNNKHAMVGYKLSKGLFPDKEIPEIIKYHHHKYSQKNQDIPLLSHVIHLADRIAVLIKDDIFILDQKTKIENIIKKYSGNNFWSAGVNGFIQLSKKEYFWLDVIAPKRIEKKLTNFIKMLIKK